MTSAGADPNQNEVAIARAMTASMNLAYQEGKSLAEAVEWASQWVFDVYGFSVSPESKQAILQAATQALENPHQALDEQTVRTIQPEFVSVEEYARLTKQSVEDVQAQIAEINRLHALNSKT
jgi:aspartate/methionine/tyrosine aminotransferase